MAETDDKKKEVKQEQKVFCLLNTGGLYLW